MSRKLNVMTVFGTRPEAIKMAPVVSELRRREDAIRTIVTTTGQHREMLDQVLEIFDIRPDFELDVMTSNQSLAGVTCRIMERLDPLLSDEAVDLILVQGDTTTVFVAALAAFYHRIPVGHVEAGLRTGDRDNPFPEEINRVLASHLSSLHFAPTQQARSNLLAEGIAESAIHVTGNTVIDALLAVVQRDSDQHIDNEGRRRILVTAHRRESWGEPLREVCRALQDIVEMHRDVELIFPVHLNPNVRETVHQLLGERDRIILTEPLGYEQFAREMARSDLVLTDSGGIQEEAPSLGKPVLVLRNETERQEGVEAGTCLLVGPNRQRITHEVNRLLTDENAYREMATAVNPYGDGHAARRIVDTVLEASHVLQSGASA